MLADAEDVALSFEQNTLDQNKSVQTDKIRHPFALLFHLLFRSISIFLFLFSTLFIDNFITIFVTTIIFLSMDFWTVKNITGRLLVGLRWWNYVDDEGKSHWVYESRKNNEQNQNSIIIESATESRLFWLGLIVSQLVWSVFFLISLFTFKFGWLTIICVAFVLNGSNLYGFLKCKFGSNQGITSMASDYFKKQMFKSVLQRATAQMMNPLNSESNDPMIPK